jgi:hypothetical protein
LIINTGAHMALFSKKSGKEGRNMVIAGLAILALGAGTATAAISIGPDTANPAARPLTINKGVFVQPAFGGEDEDCVYATHKVVMPNGRFQVVRRLECAE